MAVHIQYPDGTRQWVRGTLYQGRNPGYTREGWTKYEDGFTVFRDGRDYDYGSGCSVLALGPDDSVDLRRYRPSSSLSPVLNWAIFCEEG